MTDHDIEKTIVKQIVADAIDAGYFVSVNDGEDFVLKFSRDKKAIIAAMFSADEDRLIIRAADRSRIGAIYLVYGNGADVICDHTDTPAIDALLARANATADRLSA